MKRRVWAAAALVVATAGCGAVSSSSPAREAAETGEHAVRDAPLTGPPPLTLHRPEGDVDLPAFAWCFFDAGVGGCADGPLPTSPPQTTATDSLTFSFPLDEWSFTAWFRPPGGPTDCERVVQVDPVDRGDGTFVVPALGPAGTWTVQVSGRGDGGGSLSTAFTWTTSTDATTSPDARGVVWFLGAPGAGGGDEGVAASSPTLALTGLDVEPTEVTAELVLSDGAASATYPLHPAKGDRCPDDGTTSLAGEHPSRAVDLPDLGEPPYTYEVRLILDGTEHVGTGQWPDDLTPPMSNELALTWSPPLPSWNGLD